MIQTADAAASAKLARAMFKLSLPGAVQQVVAETALGPAGISAAGPLAGKTADRRPAHRLRLPRPAMLAARDGARCAAGGAAGAADGARRMIFHSVVPAQAGPMQLLRRDRPTAEPKEN